MNVSMATISEVSLLFSEAKDQHGVWFIVSMSGFEILFESGMNDGCLFWFVIKITVLNFGLVYGKSSMLFWVVVFDETIGGFELAGTLPSWFSATGLLLVQNSIFSKWFIEFCSNWRLSSASFNLLFASVTSFSTFSFSVSISSSFFVSISLISLSNYPSNLG